MRRSAPTLLAVPAPALQAEQPGPESWTEGLAALRELAPFAPATAQDVLAWWPAELGLDELCAALVAAPAIPRTDLVGDHNRAGGSGGAFGRFVEIGTRFLKSSERRRYTTLAATLAAEGARENVRRVVGVYPPERWWFASRGADEAIWACSLTPRLVVLRERFNQGDPRAWDLYLEAIEATLEVDCHHGLWLDCNPNNFGEGTGGLFYLDDDLGERRGPSVILQALLRLREYPEADPADRHRFLAGLSLTLERFLPWLPSTGHLIADLDNELLWPQEPKLRALLQALGRQLVAASGAREVR